ncbi:MAG: sigma-54 interaction domain-containing protein [Candidatus Eiseniibacteriota bacterium]
MVRSSDPVASERPLRKGADGRPTREALERQNFELTALLEIARGLLSAGDPGQAVGQFLLSCVAGVGAASAAGLRWEADRGRLRLWRHYGYQEAIVTDIRPVLDPEDLVFLESAEARSGVSLKPSPGSDRCRDFVRRNGDWLARLDAQAIVPLVGRGGFYGLAVWGPRLLGEDYGDDELDLLATAAQLCTQALENLLYHSTGAASGEQPTFGPVEPTEAPGALEPDAGPSAHLGKLSLSELRRRFPITQEIVGESPTFERFFREVAMVAPARCPVLILGETGTGKELAARAIHHLSPRAERPFEVVDCGSIPRELIESELFGHVRGAFTGATRDRRGAFELANGGTLFLDEIGELPNGAQTRLLRVLQEGRFRRVGDERAIQVDVRVVAATNRDLLSEVKAGRFREDLYYRLNVFCIRLPALRERRQDIPLLVSHVLDRLADDLGGPPPRLPTAVLRRLEEYAFPGNIRELRNLLTALVLRTQGRVPTLEDLDNLLEHSEAGLLGNGFASQGAGREARPASGPGSRYPDAPAPVGAGTPYRDPDDDDGPSPSRPLKRDVETTGAWVLDQLRRCDFNLSQAERSLARLRRSPAGRAAAPVADRSSLTYYFQGECFKAFAAAGFDLKRAARAIAVLPDLEDRARARLEGYLEFVIEITNEANDDNDARERCRARLPKLPAPYLPHLDAVVDACRRGGWSLGK